MYFWHYLFNSQLYIYILYIHMYDMHCMRPRILNITPINCSIALTSLRPLRWFVYFNFFFCLSFVKKSLYCIFFLMNRSVRVFHTWGWYQPILNSSSSTPKTVQVSKINLYNRCTINIRLQILVHYIILRVYLTY